MKTILRMVFGLALLFLPASNAAGLTVGFLYDGCNYTTFEDSKLYGINDAGTMVGSIYDSSHGLIIQDGAVTVSSYSGVRFNEINDSGEIVGSGLIGDGYTSFIIDGNTMSRFHYGFYGINNDGIVVGRGSAVRLPGNHGKIYEGAYYPFDVPHDAIYDEGVYTTFDFPGASQTTASDINNLGQIAGYYFDEQWHKHGFYGNISIDFPKAFDTYITGVNDLGLIIGYYTNTEGTNHGFTYPLDGNIYTSFDYDCNILGYGTLETYAQGINNFGQIVGYAEIGIIPDASVMLLLGSSLMGLGVFSRKSKRS